MPYRTLYIKVLSLVRLARVIAERRVRKAAAHAAARASAEEYMVKAKRKKEELDCLQERWSTVSKLSSDDQQMKDSSNSPDSPDRDLPASPKGDIEITYNVSDWGNNQEHDEDSLPN